MAATIARTHADVTATATGANGIEAIVARSTAGLESTLRTLRLALIVVGLLGLLVSAAVGWVLASRALRPVDRMRQEVNEITGTSLGRRLAGGGPDELGLLAAAFNRLLARAEVAAREQESFVADASHELKTPITAIEGHARVVVRAIDRSDLPQARESAEIVHREARRLAVMLRELLALSEAGSGAPEPAAVRLDLAVVEACSEIMALEPGRVVEQDLAPAVVLGEHGRLRELALILIDNAIKYSPADAPVTVAVREHPPRLTVRDRGPGMSADDSARAFDRFFRGAAAAGRPRKRPRPPDCEGRLRPFRRHDRPRGGPGPRHRRHGDLPRAGMTRHPVTAIAPPTGRGLAWRGREDPYRRRRARRPSRGRRGGGGGGGRGPDAPLARRAEGREADRHQAAHGAGAVRAVRERGAPRRDRGRRRHGAHRVERAGERRAGRDRLLPRPARGEGL